MAKPEMIDVRGRVRKEELDFFKQTFPQTGAIQWFVSTALLCFNEMIREDPSLKADIDTAIHRMTELSKSIAKVG